MQKSSYIKKFSCYIFRIKNLAGRRTSMFKSMLTFNLFVSLSATMVAGLTLLTMFDSKVAVAAEANVVKEEVDFVLAQATPRLPNPDFQRPVPQPSTPPQPLPAPEEIIPATPNPNLPSQPTAPDGLPVSITVKRFIVKGSTVLTAAEIERVTSKFTNRPLDFTEILQVASEITQLYVQKGYITSGAYVTVPQDRSTDVSAATIDIQVVEGTVEDIVVTGTKRLDPNYVKNRVALGAGKTLQIDRLIDSLRLLQLDPLIKSISTELISGQQPGTSIVQLKIAETPNWQTAVRVANDRTPSVGEIQAQISASQNNLLGIGDGIGVAYGKSEGGSVIDFNYTLPLNPRNGTLRFNYSNATSKVIEAPFNLLDINSNGQDFGLTYRQPIHQTPAQEFALGVTLARRDANTGFLSGITGVREPYPTPGADANGVTRVTAARLFQDYTVRDTEQVFAMRSQLSVGLNALNATINTSSPDSKFLTWRGQAQYVRSLAPNSIFLAKLETQIADRPLLPLEQIGLGGQETVRGYRQDLLLADNGVIASAEARFPLFTPPDSQQVLQIAPFVDFGWGWNKPNNPSPALAASTIAGGGLGLRYQSGDSFFARLDYGIPLMAIEGNKRTGQEKGFYFSVGYNQSF
jgi:hemolysin activation/secretion protein